MESRTGSKFVTTTLRSVSFLLLLAATALLLGCRRERPTEVRVEGGETPVFVFSGSGKLSSFSVYLVPAAPLEMDKPFSEQIPVWEITAQPDPLRGRSIEEIQKLIYGTIPTGYTESFPKN